jgi:hypothetical protein
MTIAELLAALETISRDHPRRVLRLQGQLPPDHDGVAEPFDVLIFRGFSSSVTHPTAVDPDQPLLPEGSLVKSAVLLQGPLQTDGSTALAGPLPADWFLVADRWR